MSTVKFGLRDYWRMFRKYGPRLPLAYFLDAQLFDLIHKTNTHSWLPKDYYESMPENLAHGVLYMSSWTSEITRSFGVMRLLVDDFEDFTLVDIGCGKGKVVLVWQKLLTKYNLNQRVFGIDYYEPLILIARSNHSKLFSGSGNFICTDATGVDFGSLGEKLIIYLYNPFDEKILGNVLRNLESRDVFVIYNYPLHASTLLNLGFEPVYRHSGFHPNCQTIIFKRNSIHAPLQQFLVDAVLVPFGPHAISNGTGLLRLWPRWSPDPFFRRCIPPGLMGGVAARSFVKERRQKCSSAVRYRLLRDVG